jgi:hypothetical protein
MNLEPLQQKLPEVRAWIDRTLAIHATQARSVATLSFTRLCSFYSAELLASANVIPVAKVPIPPLASMGLTGFEKFEQLDADGITYHSSFFIRHGHERDEPLHFHELVHVVQWQHLGPERFLIAYAVGYQLGGGYRPNPFEVMAYDLQAKFEQHVPAFDVASIVRSQLDQIVPALLHRAFAESRDAAGE